MKFPKPSNWQDFQRLCTLIYNKKYNTEFTEYGSIGERQHGVDIRAKLRSDVNLTAIQCKDYKNELSETLIKNEYNEATKYHNELGEIERYIIATTNDRTVKYEKLINELSRKGPFPITIVFWDDLNDLINYHKSIIKEAYPNLLVEVKQDGDASGKFFRLTLPNEGTLLEFLVSKIPQYDGKFTNSVVVSNPREKKCVTYDRMNGWQRLRDAFDEDLDAFAAASFIDSFKTIDDLLAQHGVADNFYLNPVLMKRWGF